MSGGIDNIDFNATIDNGRIFCQYSNAPLAFLVICIHNKFADALILAEDMALLEQAVHQGGFSMIDVGNNSNIANIVALY